MILNCQNQLKPVWKTGLGSYFRILQTVYFVLNLIKFSTIVFVLHVFSNSYSFLRSYFGRPGIKDGNGSVLRRISVGLDSNSFGFGARF